MTRVYIDEENWYQFGGGFIDSWSGFMSPERVEAERAAQELELRELEEEDARRQAEKDADAAFWSAQHNEEPKPYDPLKRIVEIAGGRDREPRRQHDQDCGCATCDSAFFGVRRDPRPRPEDPFAKQKADLAAKVAAEKAKPATMGELGKLKAWLERKVSGRTEPISNFEFMRRRAAELSLGDDEDVRLR